MQRLKRKYVPDIIHLGALCESNYRKLMKLVHVVDESDELTISLYVGERFIGNVHAKNIERAKYTDTLLLEQISSSGKWVNNPAITVRMYHDAAVAEVISSHGHKPLKGVNEYPNQFMHHPDEKIQLNRFLAEWLNFCLAYGCCDSSPFTPSKL
jgi:uncharacterized protein YqiB (DUF1249 family)